MSRNTRFLCYFFLLKYSSVLYFTLFHLCDDHDDDDHDDDHEDDHDVHGLHYDDLDDQ